MPPVILGSSHWDTLQKLHRAGILKNLYAIGPLHQVMAPSYFTYGSHAALWMVFTSGVIGSTDPWLTPKAGELFRMAFAGHAGRDGEQSFLFGGANIVEDFRKQV